MAKERAVEADEQRVGAGDDSALATALAQAVRVVGRNLAADPRRVQAMVRDVLGSESRARRAEIDAVVVAAEESVPEDLLAGRIDVGDAVDRLSDRGLAPDIALFAVAVWRYALGLLADTADPPTRSNSVERPSDRASDPVAPATVIISESNAGVGEIPSVATTFDGRQHVERPTPSPTTLVEPAPSSDERIAPPGSSSQRKLVVVLCALVALVATLVVVLTRGGDGEVTQPTTVPRRVSTTVPSTEPATTTVAEAQATTAVSTEPSTTSTSAPDSTPALPSGTFTVETTDVGDAVRTWTADGEQLTGTIKITNPRADRATGWYYEVFPASMVTSLDQVAPLNDNVPFFPFSDGAVVRFLVDIPPKGTATLGYVVTLRSVADQSDIAGWQADQIIAAATFREAAPTLAFDTASGSVISSPKIELTGTASGAARVTVGGVDAKGFDIYTAAGQWWQPLSGLKSGTNSIEVIAISPFGVKTTSTWTVTYRPPTKPPAGGGTPGGGGTNSTTTSTTTTTTIAIVPPPP